MRTIRKRPEPATLAEHRCTPFADYDNYADKESLRQALVKEQRGLCCYCLSRIRPHADHMKIEHWHCRERYPREQLDYANLLGACLGNTGREQHCDTRKASHDLSRNPARPEHRVEESVRFMGDGRIGSNDPRFERELDEVLNLNAAFLRNNRKAVLDAFKEALNGRGPLARSALETELRKWNGELHDHDLEPFCQVVVYWLRKRLSRRQ